MDGRAHGKQRGCSPGAAARHSTSARVNTEFLRKHCLSQKIGLSPYREGWTRKKRNFFCFLGKSVRALNDCEWCAAAAGLNPLRLPCAPLLPWWYLLQTCQWACPYISLCSNRWDWCVLLCFIKLILGNPYVRSRGCIVSEPRETHPRSEIADVPTLPCPPLDNLGCPDPHPPP